MRVSILPTGSPAPGHALTGFLIDGVLAVDAGPLGTFGTLAELGAVADVLLTHSHIDHIAGLPIFLDATYGACPNCPTIHGLPETLRTLQVDLFNDRLMPDFIGLSKTLSPFLQLHEVQHDRPFGIGRYTVTALPVKHTVPTVAYLVDDRTSAVAIVTDTAPVPDVLAPLARWPRLKTVFLECSFPARLEALAESTGHLTTRGFRDMAALFPASVAVVATHVKPQFYAEIRKELGGDYPIGEAGSAIDVGGL